MVGSLITREIAGDAPIFTTDLSVRAPAWPAPERLVVRGELLRAGSSAIASEVLLEADEAPFAYGQTSFRRLKRPVSARPEEPQRRGLEEVIDLVPLERPLGSEAGIVVADSSRGRVELPLRNALLHGEVVQGGVVALVVEEAAIALAEHGNAGPHVVTELDMRYLASGRHGPIVSSADWVAGREDAMLRVVLRDAGRENRITTVALARVAPVPSHGSAAQIITGTAE
jgi:acyl-coenzyme A thioesterase PaaI-like protein